MSTQVENNKRIAKNTLLLYIRMIITMCVSLYTSRIILSTLGIEDYGIYNVVGGVVAMFSIISSSISSAISRFITFELGIGNIERLKKIFSTSVTIQIILGIIVLIIAEIVGVWFLNYKMNISVARMYAANWVFQLSILTFILNLISLPYNAAIIAHEKMTAFAYVSIIEVVFKLLIAFLVTVSPIDKLIFYAILHVIVAFTIQSIYMVYCKKHFYECTFQFILDKILLKKMFEFAGWNFIGTSSGLLRDQGGNILINIFFGTSINAARGIAMQVNTALYSFVSNFMTALNPQITKLYAQHDYDNMMKLIYRGSKFSCYLLFMLSLPVLINTEYILTLWLKEVPEYTVSFLRLILFFSLSDAVSRSLITAQLATGNIRNYQLVVGGIQMMNLPISYIFLKLGFSAETIFVVAIIVSILCFISRLYMLRKIIPFSASSFLREVYVKIILVCIFSSIIPIILYNILNINFLSFILNSTISILSCIICSMFIGCNKMERNYIISFIKKNLHL